MQFHSLIFFSLLSPSSFFQYMSWMKLVFNTLNFSFFLHFSYTLLLSQNVHKCNQHLFTTYWVSTIGQGLCCIISLMTSQTPSEMGIIDYVIWAELLNFSEYLSSIGYTQWIQELKLETWFMFLQTCGLSNKMSGLPTCVPNVKSHSFHRSQASCL